MSYILVTYGYSQFSLFNIKTSTPTLIDKIKEISFQSIVQKLQARDKSLQKELEASVIEEEKLNKLKVAAEQDLQIEEDKYQEALKQLEAKRKKEELEQKKKEAEAKESKGKGKKEERKNQEKKKGKNEKKANVEEPGVDDKPIVELKEKINKINDDLNILNNNKNINNDKKSKVHEFLSIFSKKYKERANIKIDLVDTKGEKVNINSKGDTYANEYLIEKTVYELHSYNIPSKTEEDNKDTKKNNKKEVKKEEKKKENKDNKDNKDEPKEIELVLEPVKIDGYCFRTIKEDQNIDETEKTGKDKKGKKK